MAFKIKEYVVLILIGFLFLWGCEELFRRKIGGFAGSYPFVEYWELDATESEVLNAIAALKKEHPGMQPPDQSELVATRDSTTGYWLFVDFYYPDTKEIVHTWTRPAFDASVTTFAFVSLSSINNPHDDRLINRDFWYIANKRQIRKFRTTFVDRIKEKIEAKRNSR